MTPIGTQFSLFDYHRNYSTQYRKDMELGSKDSTKKFMAAKDIVKPIDYKYIDSLNDRLAEFIIRLNKVVHKDISLTDTEGFINKHIYEAYLTMRDNDIIPCFTNRGRQPEDMYFVWMQGRIIEEYFWGFISKLFNIPVHSIKRIGTDDIHIKGAFKKSSKPDLEVSLPNKTIYIEVQSGVQGINDIKLHKINEAKNNFALGIPTLCIHFDIFNGKAAFIILHLIDSSVLVARQQFEGQLVYEIPEVEFRWNFKSPVPLLESLNINL